MTHTAQQLADLMALPDRQLSPQDIHHILGELARTRLALSNMAGAATSLLKAVHVAGGYSVFDPRHQTDVQRGMRALEDETAAWINTHIGRADALREQQRESA